MTRVDAGEWLRAREPVAPSSLVERMSAALDVVPSVGNAWEDLLAAGIAALDRALANDDRSTALDLLAADALLTYAAEAAAEASAADLESFFGRSSPASFATRFAE